MHSLHGGLLLSALLAFACNGGGGAGEGGGGDGGAGGGEGGGGGPPPLGTALEASATSWALPAGGLTVSGFSSLRQQGGFENVGDEYWGTGDITGDGVPDLVVTTTIRDVLGTEDIGDIKDEVYGYPSNPHWRVYPGTATGFASEAIEWSLPDGGRTARGFFRLRNQTSGSASDQGRTTNQHGTYNLEGDDAWVIRDMDGDGLPDLVVTGVAAEAVSLGYVFRVPGYNVAPHWLVYRNTGAGFEATATQWQLPPIVGDTFSGLANASSSVVAFYTHQRWQLEDMNGDQMPDIVVVAVIDEPQSNTFRAQPAGHPAAPRWEVYLNDGSGFASTPSSWFVPRQRGAGDVGLNAMTGQGADDGDHRWTTTDIDGDGLLDLVVTARQQDLAMKAPGFPSDSHWEVYLNDGSSFGALSKWPLPRGGDGAGGFNALSARGRNVPGDDAWSTIDMQGDGRPDLVWTGEFVAGVSPGVFQLGRSANEPHWMIYDNTGEGFAANATRWDLPLGGLSEHGFNATSGSGLDIGDMNWSLVDISGEGRPDLVIVADVLERPDNPGSGITMPFAPGHPSADAWRVHLNVP